MSIKVCNDRSMASITSLPSGISAGSLVLLSTQTVSDSGTVDFTSNIDSTYKEYIFKFINFQPATNQTDFTFQADTGTNTNYNNGWACGLDEVAIFDEEKDSNWVSATYNGGVPNNLQGQSGLVGYWRFEEGSGTTVEDLSGKGNHGTLTNDTLGADGGAAWVDATDTPTWSTDTP